MTIIIDDCGKTVITMNRDDSKKREELPPQRIISGNVEIIAPLDAPSGGTWIGVNNHGVAACLLNRYDSIGNKQVRSRGNIVPTLLKQGSIANVEKWLDNTFKTQEYTPFTLVVIGKTNIIKCEYNGEAMVCNKQQLPQSHMMFTSSSWRSDEVLAWREKHFDKWIKSGSNFIGRLPEYHTMQPEGKKKWGIIIERDNVHTKSITQIILDDKVAKLSYKTNDMGFADLSTTWVDMNVQTEQNNA